MSWLFAFCSIIILQLSCFNTCIANDIMAKPSPVEQTPAQSPVAPTPAAQSPQMTVTQVASSAAATSAASNSAAPLVGGKAASSSVAKSVAKAAATTNVIIENPSESPLERYKQFIAQASMRVVGDYMKMRALRKFFAKSEIAYQNLMKICARTSTYSVKRPTPLGNKQPKFTSPFKL